MRAGQWSEKEAQLAEQCPLSFGCSESYLIRVLPDTLRGFSDGATLEPSGSSVPGVMRQIGPLSFGAYEGQVGCKS